MGKEGLSNLLIGSYTARLDNSGRLKIPEKFREIIEQSYGKEVFITSLTDEAVQIYPLSVWEEMTKIANEGALHLRPDVRRFLLRVNLKGSYSQIDAKGRVLINQTLREKANLNSEVEVIGLNNHLEIWNKEVLNSIIEEKPLTEEDFENIARLVPRGKTE
ncbi:MAG: division/cell wall cluster transcriptional repressor MraZ [Candidatus Saccharicenans sp.]